jgi:DNA polymerase sigma
VFNRISEIVKGINPDSKAFLYGSEAAQISLKDSDIDISISKDILLWFDPGLDL